MIADFHTHILPNIDDGSSSLEESIRMLRSESDMGIKHVVLTPHFYAKHDNPDKFLKRRNESYLRLSEELKKHSGMPTLHLGAEVYYFDGMSKWEGLRDLSIDGSGYVLVEMPFRSWTSRMYKELEDIYHNQGLVAIIAHVDRYITPLNAYDIFHKLSKLPVLIQVNSSFFTKSMMSLIAFKMLDKGMIHVIGSDCHNMTSRPPNLDLVLEKIEEKLGKDIIKAINAYEREILE